MSNDNICGAECADGTPCEHPAGSCPVPSHDPDADDDVDNPHGRPSAFSDELARRAIAAAEKGKSEGGIEREVGVGDRTIFGDDGWVDQAHTFVDADGTERDFSRALRRARARGEDEWLDEGRSDDGDSSFAKFMLASSYDYKKTEKKEVTGEDGGPVEVELNETIVETSYESDS
jgi:hypothetical protein